MTLTIGADILAALHAHAASTYPDECCGFIITRHGRDEVVRVSNVQNELHAKDTVQFPRTAAIAYTMGSEAAPILMGAERGELTLRAIFHSHPDHDAYFSAEDRTQAFGGWDEPNYPDAAQLVISVRAGTVRATKAFVWDAAVRDFVEVEIVAG